MSVSISSFGDLNNTDGEYGDYDGNKIPKSKLSEYWDLTGTPIYIDGTATGVGAQNWSWAVSQPWCYVFINI